jgi:hypothetical protein
VLSHLSKKLISSEHLNDETYWFLFDAYFAKEKIGDG